MEQFVDDKDALISVSMVSAESMLARIIGYRGRDEWNKIPDKRGINFDNALFFTNKDNTLRFNSMKYKNARYFNRMKNRIRQHWFPPISGSALVPSRINPNTNMYTPGITSVMTVPSQLVKLYFVLNRSGEVLEVKIVDSKGYQALDNSCIRSITQSKSFGPVPEDIPGERIVIKFIFGYFVR